MKGTDLKSVFFFSYLSPQGSLSITEKNICNPFQKSIVFTSHVW